MSRCNNCLETEASVRMWGRVLWCRQCVINAGALGRQYLVRHDHGVTSEGFTPEVLKALADGPIMDSNALYLPAGRLSMEEYRAREQRILRGDA